MRNGAEVLKMSCYAVPLAASVIIFGGRKAIHKENEKSFRLGLMMAGGSVFGVVDHAWNGELAMAGPDLASDLLLGVAITASIAIAWAASEFLSLAPHKTPAGA
jgi:hypothetical protein